MWNEYYNVTTIEEVLPLLAERREKARIVCGGTDLILEMERGARKGIETLIDITRVPGLDQIHLDEDGLIHLGPLVTHNHCVASKLIQEAALPLALACWQVGSPQIRNRGTVAGNVITASPANDTIPALMALGAEVVLRSQNGERSLSLENFYQGVRKVDMQPDEMLVDICFPSMKANQVGSFFKFALRRAQAISVVNAAVVLELDGRRISSARITLGSVAPTIIHAVEAEQYLIGKEISPEVIEEAARLASLAARPIDDIRSSKGYRTSMVKVSVRRALQAIASGEQRGSMPASPVLLWGKNSYTPSKLDSSKHHQHGDIIRTTVNGKALELKPDHSKNLLRLLREDASLIGSKEGCSEGECGACTVFLDGAAVMSCLVPAERAHGAEIVTVEGLSNGDTLHPVQEAFVEDGAVQCGYCTPGFLMSAAKLLEERAHPTQEEIRHAITGNLCRCTGYYKIIEAIEHAAVKANGR